MHFITSSRESTRYTNSFDIPLYEEGVQLYFLRVKNSRKLIVNLVARLRPALVSAQYLLAFIKAASFQAVQFAQTFPTLRWRRSMYFSVVLRHKNIFINSRNGPRWQRSSVLCVKFLSCLRSIVSAASGSVAAYKLTLSSMIKQRGIVRGKL